VAILFLCLFCKDLQKWKEDANGKIILNIEKTIEEVHHKVCEARKQVDAINPVREEGLKRFINLFQLHQAAYDSDFSSASNSSSLAEDDPDMNIDEEADSDVALALSLSYSS
jgi:hypothetical protein